MNIPSTSSGNWRWRFAGEFLTDDVCLRLADETIFYRRVPENE
jgi:4-alpha-glucanotransferase